MKQEEYERLEKLMSLNQASPEDVNDIIHYFLKYVNPKANVCYSCGDSIRSNFEALKVWFGNNKNTLLNGIEFQNKTEAEKKKDVELVGDDKTKILVDKIMVPEKIKQYQKKLNNEKKLK